MYIGDYRAAARADRDVAPSHAPSISLALAPYSPGGEWPRFGVRDDAVTIEMQLPTGLAGTVLNCHIQASPRSLPLLQRYCHRALNDRRSGQVTAAMVLLLALCGW